MRIMLRLAVATALATATPAFACELEPAGTFSLPSAAGKTAGEIIGGLVTVSKSSLPGCTDQQIVAALVAANNWQPSTQLGNAPMVIAVRSSAAIAPAAASDIPKQPLTEVAAAAKLPPVSAAPAAPPVRSEVLTGSVSRDSLSQQIDALKKADGELRKQIADIPTSELSTEQLALLSRLQAIPNLEALLAKLPTKGEVPVATLSPADRQLIQNATDASSLAEAYLGRWTLDWMILCSFLGVLILGIIIVSTRRRLKAIESQVAAQEMPDLSGFATKEELAKVVETLDAVKEQSGLPDIRFGDGQREALAALPKGKTFSADVFVDTEQKFSIRFKRIDDGNYVADEAKSRFKDYNPTTPIKDPYRFICRNYGRGEFAGFLLSSVPTAAAA